MIDTHSQRFSKQLCSFAVKMIPSIVLFTTVLQAVVGDSVRQISGYVGESVTLPSGVNISVGTFTLEWHILDNKTWIATHRGDTKNVERFWRYKGRLSLHESTGDLEIRNLTLEDAIEYTVDFSRGEREQHGKVQLTVKQRPWKPNIMEQVTVLKGKDCMMALECSSLAEGLVLTWGWNISPKLWITGLQNDNSFLWATFNPEREVTFTCTASNDVGNATHSLTSRCHDEKPAGPDIPSKNTGASDFGWVILGLLIGAVLAYILRVQIEKMLTYIKEKLGSCFNFFKS